MIKVYSAKNEPLYPIVKQIFSDFDLLKHKKVFIKPNLGGRYPIVNGENTKFDILGTICRTLQENGCEEIVIGHTSLLNFVKEKYDFKDLIRNSGFEKLSKYKIVKFLCLDNVERIVRKARDVEFHIPKILETYFYINLCCLKTHMETTVSLSLKNQVGLLLASERMRKHKIDLDGHIAYLGVAAKPNLNIIDGRIGMEGNGPHHGRPKRANMILCGDDMVEIDSLACALIGIEFTKVKHIKIAIEERIGEPMVEMPAQYKQYTVKFKQPDLFYGKYNFLRVWPNKACSGCIFTLSDAHKAIIKNPVKLSRFINNFIKAKKIDIILGMCAEINATAYSKNAFLIGNCTADFAKSHNLKNFLPGCPPSKDEIAKFMIKA